MAPFLKRFTELQFKLYSSANVQYVDILYIRNNTVESDEYLHCKNHSLTKSHWMSSIYCVIMNYYSLNSQASVVNVLQ